LGVVVTHDARVTVRLRLAHDYSHSPSRTTVVRGICDEFVLLKTDRTSASPNQHERDYAADDRRSEIMSDKASKLRLRVPSAISSPCCAISDGVPPCPP